MAKIFSGLTLILALVAAFFAFQSKDMVGKLQVAAEREHTDLIASKEKVKKAEKDLVAAKEAQAKAEGDLTAAKEALTKAEDEQKKAVAERDTATQAKTTAEGQYTALKTTYDELTAKLNGKTPEEILKSIADMEVATKDLQAKVAEATIAVESLKHENTTLSSEKKSFDDKLAGQKKVIERYKSNIMQKGVRGTVLAVNSGWGFCVLSIGDRKGAAANKILIVARGGQAIGKVRITSVENAQSVADIIPSSFTRGTYVQPGDDVIFTGEDKVPVEPTAPTETAPTITVAPSSLPLPPP